MTEPKYDPTTQPYDEPLKHVNEADLVERLRFWPTRPAIMGEIRRDIVDAADEIERLRAALQAIKAFTDTGEPDWNDAIGDHVRAALTAKP